MPTSGAAAARGTIDRDQRARWQNLLAAGGVSAALIAWASIGALAGFIDRSAVLSAAVVAAIFCGGGLLLVRTNWNLRLSNPGLAKPMVLAATGVVLLMAHQVSPALRSVWMPWIIMAFAFGGFGARTRALVPLAWEISALLIIETIWFGLIHGQWSLILWQTTATLAAIGCIAAFSAQVNRQRAAATRQMQLDKTVLDSIADAVVSLDESGGIQHLNRAAEELLGSPEAVAKGRRLVDCLRWESDADASAITSLVTEADASGSARVRAQATGDRQGDAPLRDLECSSARVEDRKGQVFGRVLVLRDVTESAQLMRQLEHDSFHDELTGLQNRRGLHRALDATMAAKVATNAEGSAGRPSASHRAAEIAAAPATSTHAVMIVDLDQFKIVNDTCGHAAGDHLIRQVARTLLGAVRGIDVVTRYGGDEFAILLRDASRTAAYDIGQRILDAIANLHFEWGGRRFQTGASIGCALIDARDIDVDQVMLRADSALYLAKDLGRGRMQMHADGDEHIARKSRELEWACRINDALQTDTFELYAQRIEAAQVEDRERYELLIRLRDGTGEVIAPGEFLPAAERFNLMPALDRWVVRRALQQLSDARDQGATVPWVAINLSAQSLQDRTFLTELLDRIRQSRLPTDCLCFELTETVAVANFENARAFIDSVRALGCQFALDDVGAGFNSFSYLRHLTFDSIKIDGHYVRGVDQNTVDRTLVQSLIDAATTMGLTTVAEMVETSQVAATLRGMGVQHLQGYALHRPEPLRAVLAGGAGRSGQQAASPELSRLAEPSAQAAEAVETPA